MSISLSVVVPLALLGVVALAPVPANGRPAPPAGPSAAASAAARPTDVVRLRTYRMSGRIRPLLIWMGKDDVGLARVTWRVDEEGRRGYELLIGTDPARAPRGLNRWGFVSEQMTVEGGDLLALMTGAVVGSFAEAKADTASARQAAHLRVMRGRIAHGLAEGRVVQLGFDRAPTVHDLDAVLMRLHYDEAAGNPAQARARSGSRPGLLTALADVVDRLGPIARDGRAPLDRATDPAVPYVFGRDGYELHVRGSRTTWAERPGRARARAIETEFEIVTAATGARTRFEMTTGLDGDLAGVPLTVRWQPRWWLEVGLHLTE
jgi:hypothetical protein